MGKKEFEQTIKISTQFDVEEIIKGFKQIQAAAKATEGINPKDFDKLNFKLKEAQELASKFAKAMEAGLSNPDDIKNLQNLNNAFKNLATEIKEDLDTGIKKGFRDAKRAIEQGVETLEQELNTVRERINNTLKEKGIGELTIKIGSKEKLFQDIIDKIKSSKELEKVHKAINQELTSLDAEYKTQTVDYEGKIKFSNDLLESLKAQKDVLNQQNEELERMKEEIEQISNLAKNVPKQTTTSSFLKYFQGLDTKGQKDFLEETPFEHYLTSTSASYAQILDLKNVFNSVLKKSTATNKQGLIQEFFSQNFIGGTVGDFLKNVGLTKQNFQDYISEMFKVPADIQTRYNELSQKIKEATANGANAETLANLENSIKQAEEELNKLTNQLAEYKQKYNETKTGLTEALGLTEASSDFAKDVDEAARKTEEYAAATKKAKDEKNKFIEEENKQKDALAALNQELVRGHKAINNELKSASSLGKVIQNVGSTFDQLSSRLNYFVSIFTVFRKGRQVIRQTFQDVQNLDKAFSSIAMVTSNTVSDLWKSYSRYADIANKLGQSTESAIEASALYYQQGLETNSVMQLTESTLKLATLSQQNFETTTKQLTAAIRGFNMEMSEANNVTDVYSELAAHAAADVQGIAYSMSKVASIAASSGSSFENTAAFLTQMIN